MSDLPRFRLESVGARAVLRLSGPWRLAHLARIEGDVAALETPPELTIDCAALESLDSAAALLLLRRFETPAAVRPAWVGLSEVDGRILQRVRERLDAMQPPAVVRRRGVLAHVGEVSLALLELVREHLHFLGGTMAALGAVLIRPGRLRPRELTAQLEQAGLNAIPVVSLVTLLIGVVMAYLLGLQAEKFGANIFVVDGVGVGATREFAPIIVAIVVAGRSGAAFTAQLGSMRLTEEVDAIRVLGLDEWQVLVLPRVLALMVALPLLVFVGDLMSLLGAMLVTGTMLDVTPSSFIDRLQIGLHIRHVLVGLVKAPVFALVIAVIGTRMGMTVGRDTRALGVATTSTVVQCIVAVILLDAAFAVLFQALDI